MDFMFEDEVDEVGSDVEAYCPKCKADTTHVVISKYEDEIRRVQCNPCGDVHSFRKPRGEVEEDVPEPIAAKKRAMIKKPTWEEFFAKHGEKEGRPYEFREAYTENIVVTHPKFGRGFVSEVLSDSKVEITFKDARRVLVHNRKDMPGLPLAAEGDGIPSTGAKAKAAKSKAAREAAAAKPVPPVAPAGAGKAAAAAKAEPAEPSKGAASSSTGSAAKAHAGKAARNAAPKPSTPPAKAAARRAARPARTARPAAAPKRATAAAGAGKRLKAKKR